MNNTSQNVDILLIFPLFTVLGLTIFLVGCSTNYSYTHTQGGSSEISSEISTSTDTQGGSSEISSEISTSEWKLREHIKFHWISLPTPGKYTGPQNAQALMNALDAGYNRGHSKTEVSISRTVGNEKIIYNSNLTESEIDARYPRAEWLQMLLDRGITVENFGDYSRYLLKRHTLALLEANPNLRQLGIHDIPPTANWETYKAAYINNLVYAKVQKASKQVERRKKQVERGKKQVERAKKQSNPQQLKKAQVKLENANKQLEDARKQLKRAEEALERSKKSTLPR